MKLLVGSRATLLLLLPAAVLSVDPNQRQVLNLAYGAELGPLMTNYTAQQMVDYIQQIKPISAISNFMLNVEQQHLANFQPLLQSITQDLKIPMYPALGKPIDSTPINDDYYKSIAMGYYKWTNCIQLDGPQEYVEGNFDPNDLIDMIDWLTEYGFEHIQMNAWPFYANDLRKAYSFTSPAVDSAIENVILDPSTYNANDPENWTLNPARVTGIFAANPNARIITNYENPGQEEFLARLSSAEIINAFETTIRNISGYGGAASGKIYWTAPWSHSFDPIAKGVWSWITNQYAQGNPS